MKDYKKVQELLEVEEQFRIAMEKAKQTLSKRVEKRTA